MVVSILVFLVWYCLSWSLPKRQGETVPYQKDKERQYHTKKKRIDTTIPKRQGETVPYQKDKERQYHTKKTRRDSTIPKRQG
jgi:hypothetical protein